MGRPGVTFSPDMGELLELFETHQVRYALVGGFAAKRSSDRPRDQADADELLRTRRR